MVKINLIKKSKGSTLLFAVLVLSFILIMGLSVAQTIFIEQRLSSGYKDSQAAYYVAESGMEMALKEIVGGNLPDQTEKCIDGNSNACYRIEIETSGIHNCGQKISIISWGRAYNILRKVEVKDFLSSLIVDERNNEVYTTIEIGGRCLFAENLNVGTMISGSLDQGTSCTNIQKYCHGNNESNCDIYGGLYQWNQAMCGSTTQGAQGICPVGWHLPTDEEIKALEMYLGMSRANADATGSRGTNEGAALAGNAALWNGGGIDLKIDPRFGESGFNVLPAGFRSLSGNFSGTGSYATIWTSTESGFTGSKWGRTLDEVDPAVNRNAYYFTEGFSARCLKSD